MENIYREVLNQKDVEVKQSFIECVANLFSAIMEETVTTQQARSMLNIIASVMLLIFPVSMPIVIRIIAFVWLLVAAWQCKEANMLYDDKN